MFLKRLIILSTITIFLSGCITYQVKHSISKNIRNINSSTKKIGLILKVNTMAYLEEPDIKQYNKDNIPNTDGGCDLGPLINLPSEMYCEFFHLLPKHLKQNIIIIKPGENTSENIDLILEVKISRELNVGYDSLMGLINIATIGIIPEFNYAEWKSDSILIDVHSKEKTQSSYVGSYKLIRQILLLPLLPFADSFIDRDIEQMEYIVQDIRKLLGDTTNTIAPIE